jgi:hypothetical protein
MAARWRVRRGKSTDNLAADKASVGHLTKIS